MPSLRALGTTHIKTPALVLGCNVFGWTADEKTSHGILDAFVEGGGTLIDTADIYGPPTHTGALLLDHVANREAFVGRESERIIGSWFRKRGKRDGVYIATKAGMHSRAKGASPLSAPSLRAAVDESLRTLCVERIDLFYTHIDDPDCPLEETLATLNELVNTGKIAAIAAANYTMERLQEALQISRDNDWVQFQAYQGMYSLVERRAYEEQLQAFCVDRKVAFMPYLGLANGFLTGKYRKPADIPESHPRSRFIETYMSEQGLAILAALDVVAKESGSTVAQVALAWEAAQAGVGAPLASATSVKQLNELLGSMQLDLDREQLARIDSVSRGAGALA
jgi:aryl-alcohol dehydrogenase-like predicted oxidoreductase